jgi:hypothetical protein
MELCEQAIHDLIEEEVMMGTDFDSLFAVLTPETTRLISGLVTKMHSDPEDFYPSAREMGIRFLSSYRKGFPVLI